MKLQAHYSNHVYSFKAVEDEICKVVAIHRKWILLYVPKPSFLFTSRVFPLSSSSYLYVSIVVTFTDCISLRIYQGKSDISVDTRDLLKDLQDQAEGSQITESPTAWLFDCKENRESYDRANVRGLWHWHPSIQTFCGSFLTCQINIRETCQYSSSVSFSWSSV